ncbi:MAG: AMP-binding protein, partial [Acidobacteria bacterium]|nr:AMP-binding protein [Acidobacteriota bacterium]
MSYKDGYKEQTVAAGQNTKERDYWLKKLSGEITRTILPYEFRDTGTSGGKSLTAAQPFQITGSTYAAALKISNKSDVRLHILLLTGWLILLHRYTAATDIIIGVPTYRQTVEGQLINTALALRNPVQGRMTVKELLMQVGQTILEANQNQNYPIKTLVYKLNLPDTGGDFPLFDMSLLLEEIHDKHDLDHIKQNMLISFHKSDTALEGIIEYNELLYSNDFIQRIITHYRQIMESFLANVEIPINRVEMIPAHEKQQLLREFNDNKASFPRDKIISQVITEQAERTPDRTAIIHASLHATSLQVTYSHLNQQSNHLAGLLSEKGVGPETIVAVMMERSCEMVIAILAIFKAGGVYLPIDPDCPQERVDYMLKDSQTKILITNKSEIRISKSETNPNDQNINDQNKNQNSGAISVLNFENLNLNSLRGCPRRGLQHSNHLAYIIYTSGSTGKPKGAMVEHIGMMNHMWAKVRTLQ